MAIQVAADDWQNNIIAEQRGVRLIECEDSYVVEYWERGFAGWYKRRASFTDYAIALNNFVRRVEEADYRG